MMLKPPILLPLASMARRLRVSTAWLRAEAEAGRLPHLKVDKTFLFDPDLVEQLLIERARQVPSPRPTEGGRHGR